MNRNCFLNYVRNEEERFREASALLERILDEDGCISLRFLENLNTMLAGRMRFCRRCSEHYREMAKDSFWFMRRRVLKTARMYELGFQDALYKRIAVETRISQIRYSVNRN